MAVDTLLFQSRQETSKAGTPQSETRRLDQTRWSVAHAFGRLRCDAESAQECCTARRLDQTGPSGGIYAAT